MQEKLIIIQEYYKNEEITTGLRLESEESNPHPKDLCYYIHFNIILLRSS
jgi:hypothetical protein